ncbi:hypothetical protein OROMI_024618 [Orobanche minor]
MGVGLSEIGIEMRKGVIFTIGWCYRSVCNHPFLVGNLCFLIFLYRSFPFIFSLLVSASPVLICTAILLGTVLSFGEPNIPEIEIEEKTTRGSAVSIETGISKDSNVLERNGSHYNVGRYSDVKGDGAERLGNGIRNDEICGESIPNVEEKSGEIGLGDGEIWEDTIDEPKSDNDWNEERLLGDGEDVENPYSSILKADDENNEQDDVDLFNSEMVNVDSLNSPHSPWKHVRDEEDEDDISDSGSDGGESSSPDASMDDIMPMLDELHPLLDEDSPNHIQISRSVSGIVSGQSSSRPSTSSRESADEIENCDDFEVEEDDNEDDDEDDGQADKDEGPKPTITWTEEDQKNLMDLGSSEIERNQRLENLILRRRKNVSMVPEINLIDLESSDFPPHVASISTSRQNPFDDSYDNNIPGSAPSILLQRRNPFEIPYESIEKGNPLGGDGFQEQLPFFKRHESFNVGPSVLAPNTQDVKIRPYFVPERMISEDSGFPSFRRHLSELSDSKASSIPETESIGSVEDFEVRKILEDDHSPQEPLEDVMSRTDEEEVIVEGPPEEDQEMITKKELSEEDVFSEPQLISEMNHVSEHIGHGSQSSSEGEESLEFKKSYSRGSSSSLMSEASERTFSEIDEKKDGTTFVESSKEPVYDTSPHAESNQSLAHVLVKRTVSFAERDSENREIRKGITSDAVSCVGSSKVEVRVDDNKNVSRSDDGVKRLMSDMGENVVSPNSEGDYQEAYERLTSTPSGGGSTSHFYDIAMHGPNFEHLEEVPVPNTPVESNEKMRTLQNLNIPEIYELDHETSSSIGSSFSPDFISMPSSASSHDDVHTIHEEADEIKEIDKKYIVDSVGETSTMHESGKHEEDTKYESEIDEMESQNSTVKETYEEVSKKDESTSTSQVHTDRTSGMPELETSKNSLDGVLEKDLKLNSDDGSVEVEAEKIHSSSGEESSVNKPYHEVKAPEDLEFTFTASVKWKGNKSESTSSSSSSSSSDSDGE